VDAPRIVDDVVFWSNHKFPGAAMAEKSWTELLRSHSPELDEQNRADMEYLKGSSALSPKEKYLLAIVRMFGGRGALATGCEALRQFESL
jgi:hypothetical protein